jgi:hypothetical protein
LEALAEGGAEAVARDLDLDVNVLACMASRSGDSSGASGGPSGSNLLGGLSLSSTKRTRCLDVEGLRETSKTQDARIYFNGSGEGLKSGKVVLVLGSGEGADI